MGANRKTLVDWELVHKKRRLKVSYESLTFFNFNLSLWDKIAFFSQSKGSVVDFSF